jgi:lipid-binding SYLF domain-containing protein
MKKIQLTLMITALFGLANVSFAAQVEDYSSAIRVFRESPVVEKFFKNSYGYAVFPTFGKAGFVVGGSYGKGIVYRGGKATGKSTVVEGCATNL